MRSKVQVLSNIPSGPQRCVVTRSPDGQGNELIELRHVQTESFMENSSSCCSLQCPSPPRPACHAAQSSHLRHPVAAPRHMSDLQCCISEIVGLMRPEGASMAPRRVNIINCHIQPPIDPPLTIPPSAGATFEPQPISRCTRDPSIPKHAVVLPCTQQ